MRVISLVKHLDLEFQGNVFKNAICLGDVDNDGLNELIVGNENGDLVIFKCNNTKPVFHTSCTGVITAIVVGDICNVDKNSLVVITNCGLCYIYNFEHTKCNEPGLKLSPPVHSQAIPANIKTALIGDVNGDGFLELVVAMTDRVVRSYGWLSSIDPNEGSRHERLVGLNKWELSDQIGTISFNKSADGSNVLLVAQPGGTYFTLRCNAAITGSDPEYQSLASSRLRNPNIQTEVYGNIKCNFVPKDKGSLYAIATLDGTLMLVQDDCIKWNLQVDHQLFALSCLDVTNDGNDELIACAWDGNTYIVGHNTDCIRYSFPEPVHSFTAGKYGINKRQSSSLVYVTLNGSIYLYYDIYIPHMEPTTLTDVLKNDESYLKILESLDINVDDTVKIKEFHNQILFDYQ